MDPVISQAEIDALWGSMFQGDGKGDRDGSQFHWTEVRQYDFREASQLAPHELDCMRQLGERLARHVEQSLRAFLRAPARCTLTTAEEARYRDFLNAIPDRTIIGEIALPPLSPNVLWDLSFHVGFAVVERMMGWEGPSSPPDRDPSGAELALLTTVMGKLAEWLGQAASEIFEVHPRLERLLIPPAHAGLMPESQPVVMIVMELGFAEMSGSTTLCIPTEMLMPVRDRLRIRPGTAIQRRQQASDVRTQLRAALGAVKVVVRAELGSGKVMLGELLRLASGDVVRLDRAVGEHTDIVVGERPRFRGAPGYRGKRLAVEIREIVVAKSSQTNS